MTGRKRALQIALAYLRPLALVWAGVFALFLICRVTFWSSDAEVGFYAPVLFWGLSFGAAWAAIALGWKEAALTFVGVALAGIALAYALHASFYGLREVGVLR
jgi:hypothetical protein